MSEVSYKIGHCQDEIHAFLGDKECFGLRLERVPLAKNLNKLVFGFEPSLIKAVKKHVREESRV